ncbi:MAG: CsbD family protein [Terracidiphilus sp.]
MNKQRVNGAIDEVVGSAKRHIGNLTGDTRTQIEGAGQQVKGKVETAVGKLKDAVRDAQTAPETPPDSNLKD